jgi:hypothetical protein
VTGEPLTDGGELDRSLLHGDEQVTETIPEGGDRMKPIVGLDVITGDFCLF